MELAPNLGFSKSIMFRSDLSNVAGELVAGELLEALWLRMEEEDIANEDSDGGEEEEESGDDGEDEEVGGSCSNPEEEMDESEEDSEDQEDQEGDGGRTTRITCQRIVVADTMNAVDYR